MIHAERTHASDTVEPLLAALPDATLEPVDRRAVETHLAACSRCRSITDWMLLDDGEIPAAPAWRPAMTPGERRRRIPLARVGAAVLVAAAAAAVLVLVLRGRGGQTPVAVPSAPQPPRPAGPAPSPEPPPQPAAPRPVGREDIVRAVDAIRPMLKRCATATEERIVVDFTITAEGRATGVKPSPDSTTGRCVAAAFATARFPAGGEPMDVSYPVLLRGAPSPEPPASDPDGPGRAALYQAMKDIREPALRCVDRHGYDGNLVLTLTIERSGKVSRATAEPANAAGRCVANVARKVRFPSLTQKTTLQYPLVFRPAR